MNSQPNTPLTEGGERGVFSTPQGVPVAPRASTPPERLVYVQLKLEAVNEEYDPTPPISCGIDLLQWEIDQIQP